MTAGDEDGVVLDVDAPPSVTLALNVNVGARNQFGAGGGSEKLNFSIPVAAITEEDTVHEAGGVDRAVVVRRVGRDYPRTVQFEWSEQRVSSGTSPYWVRVQQADGATAWSSPIFVTR
jgi:hypothetical protein